MSIELKAFTDGSADNLKQEIGGIGVYFQSNDMKEYNISKQMKVDCCTNQKMELYACIYAIRQTIKYMEGKCKLWNLTIYSDSMYTIKSITEYAPKWIQYGWKRLNGNKCLPIKNLELIKKLYTLYKTYDIKFIHVNSHQRQPDDKKSEEWKLWYGNDMADKLAKNAINT